MLVNGKKMKTFELSSLDSRISFSNWIKTNLLNEGPSSEDEIFKSNRYLEYLKYIETQVKKQPLKDKMEWFEKIKKLREEKERKQ